MGAARLDQNALNVMKRVICLENAQKDLTEPTEHVSNAKKRDIWVEIAHKMEITKEDHNNQMLLNVISVIKKVIYHQIAKISKEIAPEQVAIVLTVMAVTRQKCQNLSLLKIKSELLFWNFYLLEQMNNQ